MLRVPMILNISFHFNTTPQWVRSQHKPYGNDTGMASCIQILRNSIVLIIRSQRQICGIVQVEKPNSLSD